MNIFFFFMNIHAKFYSKSTTEQPICLPREKVSSRKKQVSRGGMGKNTAEVSSRDVFEGNGKKHGGSFQP